MRAIMRRALASGLGLPGRAVLGWRSRRQAERLLDERGLRAAGSAVDAATGSVVSAGPFAGMSYPRRFGDIVHAAKLLGTYEREVHPALESLVERAPSLVVNVGSGDGYYAVGIARLLAEATVIAVDPDPFARWACGASARENGVSRRLRHVVRLDAVGLGRLVAPAVGAGALCIVDCEGFEDELLDLTRAPALADADLLVETHDFARDGVTSRLMERFEATHRIGRVEVASRAVDGVAFPALRHVAASCHGALLDEYRHMPQSWLVMFSRTHGRLAGTEGAK